MTSFVRIVAALLCVGALWAQDAPPAVTPLKVVFWNVEWFPGTRPNATNADAVAQIARVVPALEKLNPDIIGMQEVMNWDAATIALFRTPGASVQVCSDFLGDNGQKTTQQLVIASRLPAFGAWWEPWKVGSSVAPRRGFSFAAYRPSPGHVLLVYCVHLKSNRGDLAENIAMREESATQLLNHVAAMEKAYGAHGRVAVVLGGDFNTSTDDPRFKMERTLDLIEKAGFTSCWKDVPFAQRVTLPSTPSNNPNYPPFPDACFDHVFVKGATVRSAEAAIIDPPPSDHRPVVVQLDIPSASPAPAPAAP